MIMDAYLLFDPAGTAITSTAASTNVLDMLNPRDMGIGEEELQIVVYSGAAFTAAGAATLNIQVQHSVDNSTWVTSEESGPIAVAALAASTKIWQAYLNHRLVGSAFPRYYRLNYVVATGPMTAGTLSASIVLDTQAVPSYPAGLVIYN